MFDLYGNLIWLLIAGIIIAAIRSRSRYRKSEQATEDPLVALGNRMARIEAAIDRLEQRLARLEGATEPQQLPERETASAVLRRPLAGAAAAERAGEILPQVSPEAKAPSSLEVATKPGPTGHPAGEAEAAVSVAGQSSKVHGFVARRVRALKGRAAASS